MNYTYDIKPHECVGDALGKINYNFLILESQLCQLSSQYFEDGFFTTFNKLSSIMTQMNFIGNEFSDAALYKQSYNATSLLSSYWNKNELTIQYPLNIETLEYNTGYTTENIQISSISTDSILIQKAQNFLNLKFRNEDLLDISSIINVSFVLYANNGSYTPITDGPYTAPPIMQYWNITLRKNDYYIDSIKNYKFQKVQNQWVNIDKT